ncbi:MAG: M4 family metallopeptidase, partial [Vicinamibacteria bacterium]|nr:M4 family metallopeptidase [Vicinamibacteria bacterium]
QVGAGEIQHGPSILVTDAAASNWSAEVDARAARGALRLLSETTASDLPVLRFRRYEQYIGGAPVFGAQLVREIDAKGQTAAVFGHLVEERSVDTTPVIDGARAAAIVERQLGRDGRAVGTPRLVLLPLGEQLVLTYMLWGAKSDPPALTRYFIDARTGAIVFSYDDLMTGAASGLGTGIWGDRKKMATKKESGQYFAQDQLRPVSILTYDMKFDSYSHSRGLWSSYLAMDSDNTWTDGAVVDAHTYIGWTYDYFYNRFGLSYLGGFSWPISVFVHFRSGYVNAYWDSSNGTLNFGDGDGTYQPLSSAIDVVAHEYSHGITEYSWNGIYAYESGALNESFSDIFGTAVEFYYQPVGSGRNMADYYCGEDLSVAFDPPRYAFRSMDNPSIMCSLTYGCDPDHYTKRYRGNGDNGGVHINAAIANQAFYLLIEGGTNRTSGIKVDGLGAAAREKAEKIFFNGFRNYLTPAATFKDARAATIRAAETLYGVGSREASQTAVAWRAVGITE